MGLFKKLLVDEPNEVNRKINWEVFLAQHPEYHLYRDLCERLPKYCRMIDKISKINWETKLNEKGLPF